MSRSAKSNIKLHRRSFLKLGGAAALAYAFAPRASAIPTRVTQPVPTNNGPLLGLHDDGINTFLGVPYAKPPTGERRFMPPEKLDPTTEITYCGRFGHSAMQLNSGGSAVNFPGAVGPALDQVFGSRGDVLMQGEDCLVLNVWTPELSSATKRPVMVWFHGGGYNYGSGSWPAYDGHNLAKNHDVVVVTVNHRLNAFGFLNLAEVGGERYKHSANAGQLDLVASLEWVRDNIANFGGDPGNVTIFGQSGGGAKVCNLMAMPSAKGLFHKAIVQSGSAISSGDPEDSAESAKALLDELDIKPNNLAKLHEIHEDQILAAAAKIDGSFRPIMDGDVIASHPFEPEASPLAADVPVMVGFTTDEMTLYVCGFEWWRNMEEKQLLPMIEQGMKRRPFGGDAESLLEAYRNMNPDNPPRYLYTDVLTSRHFRGAFTLAERKAAQSGAPAYFYEFAWQAPVENKIMRAPHTAEIPFNFDNVDKGPIWLGTDPETFDLGTRVSSLWTSFARTGKPSADGMPDWPAYDTDKRASLFIDTESKVLNDHRAEVRKLLQG